MPGRTYPADPAEAGLRLFLRWFGGYYARSLRLESTDAEPGILRGTASVGRRWQLAFTLVDTLAADATVPFEAARAAVEQRLDGDGKSVALWLPRDATLPTDEPALSELVLAVDEATPTDDGRLEVRHEVPLYLRRTGTTGSVVTVLGGLSGHWAQFTNRVPGSYQLNSRKLHRLPKPEEERQQLAERIVMAAAQPEVDDTVVVTATDAWTANDLGDGGSAVLGTPAPENDDWSASLRRNLRQLLRQSRASETARADATALIVLGAATYAGEEKLSWALRGMDPTLYSGYDLIAIVADGVVAPLLQPARGALPWDAPLQ